MKSRLILRVGGMERTTKVRKNFCEYAKSIDKKKKIKTAIFESTN